MKKILSPYVIAFTVVLTILSLPYLLPERTFPHFTDAQLRETALSRGMHPVPATLEGWRILVETPDNPLSLEKIELGKKLYFDPRLSGDGSISCSTCHLLDSGIHSGEKRTPLLDFLTSKDTAQTDCSACHALDQSGVDRFTFAVGHTQREGPYRINTPTILNVALAKHLTWSGKVGSIEEQTEIELQASHRMAATPVSIEERLKADSDYARRFESVFADGVTFANTAKAVGAYVRTLLTRGSYDRFLEGDDSAISDEAKRGLASFINLGCKGCHTGISVGGQSLQRFPLKRYALIYDDLLRLDIFPKAGRLDQRFPFVNTGSFEGNTGLQYFRVPILRNATKTSPYFHNGAIPKIREAVRMMAKHQLGLTLTDVQVDEIVAFLKTLEGEIVDYPALMRAAERNRR